MAWAIVAAVLALWLIATIIDATFNGLIHLLLVVGIVVILVQLFTGRRVV